MKKREVGSKVTIKSYEEMRGGYSPLFGFVPTMKDFCSKEATIAIASRYGANNWEYQIEEDENTWSWSEDMFVQEV